jgi:hypothetical protein
MRLPKTCGPNCLIVKARMQPAGKELRLSKGS